MQFEEFDKKIKEAADNHHPAYDEQAWAKMNKLLDKHMPEKEDRRRRFAWLFFLLFLVGGAGIFYGVQQLIGKSKELTVSAPSLKETNTGPEAGSAGNIKEGRPETEKRSSNVPDAVTPESDRQLTTAAGINLPVTGEPEPFTAKEKTQPVSHSVIGNTSVAEKKTVSRKAGTKQQNGTTPLFQSGSAKKTRKQVVKSEVSKVNNNHTRPVDPSEGSAAGTDRPADVTDLVVDAPVTNQQPAPITAPVNILAQPKKDSVDQAVDPAAPLVHAKNRKPSKSSYFFLTFSAGPDASYAKEGKPGRVIPVTGVGIGYLYKERFSIRAGFYNAAKVYSAAPDAYKAPASFYNYYPFLVNVDANCRVYELPVSLGYHFGARKNHSWFASATLSSYLMKRETYNYSYKTSAWGSIQQRKWNLYNENRHYFSVLGFSAGYQRKITNRISFIAEPYLRVPVQGVGYGNVKLNSAGVLFSLAVQPSALLPRKQKK